MAWKLSPFLFFGKVITNLVTIIINIITTITKNLTYTYADCERKLLEDQLMRNYSDT